MKRNCLIIFLLFIITVTCGAFTLKEANDRFEIGAGYSLTSIISMPAYDFQALFNASQNFYIGLRYTSLPWLYYDSVTATAAYKDSFSSIDSVFGANFGFFNERFNLIFAIIPGFIYGKRTLLSYNGETSLFFNERTGATGVSTKSIFFFSPAIEFGFAVNLTDNIILTLSGIIRSYAVEDMSWDYRSWFIKTSDTNAFLFYAPLRLTYRF